MRTTKLLLFALILGFWVTGCTGGYADASAADGNSDQVQTRLKRAPDRAQDYENEQERRR